jgi:hypothetical protein
MLARQNSNMFSSCVLVLNSDILLFNFELLQTFFNLLLRIGSLDGFP